MRADVLSQRIFTAGCFGLPWLWMVHALYYKGLENEPNNGETVSADSTNNQQGLLDADEHFDEPATTMSPQQIADVQKVWVGKCKVGAVAVLGFWIIWIVLAQVFKHDLPGNLFIRAPDDGEWTGW